jgi:hypothetical protein
MASQHGCEQGSCGLLQLYPSGQHGGLPLLWNRHHDKKLLAYAYATGLPNRKQGKLVRMRAGLLPAHVSSAWQARHPVSNNASRHVEWLQPEWV